MPTPKEFLVQRKEWVIMKEERERALATKYGKVQEDLNRHAHVLKELPVGSVVQVQNQKGKDPLRWDKSGTVVYCENGWLRPGNFKKQKIFKEDSTVSSSLCIIRRCLRQAPQWKYQGCL